MPTVSVVIPTYNRASFLRDTVESALDQTHEDIECVVVDGGSTDGTHEILNSFQDDRLIVERRDSPQGISNARNTGIELASGEFILFLDDDDRLYPDATERLLDHLTDKPAECAGVFAACEIVSDGEVKYTRSVPEERVTIDDLADQNVIGGPSGSLFKRHVLLDAGLFDESLPAREDIDLWFRILYKYYVVGIDEALYQRRTHADQAVRDDQRMLDAHEILMRKHGDRLSNRHRAIRHRDTALRLVRLGRPMQARREIFKALKLNPFEKRTLYFSFWLLFGEYGYKFGQGGQKLFHKIKYWLL